MRFDEAEEYPDVDRQRCLELLSGDGRVDHLWNVKNPDGDTPLMYCIKYKATSLVTTLLANPSQDLDTVDSDGLHLEDVARLLNRTDVLSMLATFTTVRKRMILRAKDIKDITIQILAKDALLLQLINTNQDGKKAPLSEEEKEYQGLFSETC